MVAHNWQHVKDNVVDGTTTLTFTREECVQKRYQEARLYVSGQNFRRYSDFIKVKHLVFHPRMEICGQIVSRKMKDSLAHVLVENEYPYAFNEQDNIRHYLIWSLKPLDASAIAAIIQESNLTFEDSVWFVNSVAVQSIKDLWHCHVLLKSR